jgi:hypothetical protein
MLGEWRRGYLTIPVLFFEEIIKQEAANYQQGGNDFGLGWMKTKD